MTVWRWQHDLLPGTPEQNMAFDAALLYELRASEDALPIVRVYTWDRACVTLGRSQDEAIVRAAFPGLPLVRRPTGGRAVRHGNDLTITVAARLRDLPPAAGTSILATYQFLAIPLAETFRGLGIPAQFGTEPSGQGQAHADCFAHAARCDLVDSRDGRKLTGCAQRRAGTTLLQQMSVPLGHIPDMSRFITLYQNQAAFQYGITAWDC